MKRRRFLKYGLYGCSSILGTALGLGMPIGRAWGSHPSTGFPRTLVNLMLLGGADLRFTFVPAPDNAPDYVDRFWLARQGIYQNKYTSYADMFTAEYQVVSDPLTTTTFGIHKSCGWLIQQFNQRNVAIIANVFGSLNRRHDQSVLIANTGDPLANRLVLDRDGWGGRFVETASVASNAVAISGNVPIICKGSNPANRLEHVVHGRDMRNFALPGIDPLKNTVDPRNVLNRALTAYYTQRGMEILNDKPVNWPFRSFFQQYASLREFGDSISNRLSEHPTPGPISDLNLNDAEFELQCRNLYDCCLSFDILNPKIISMEYTGWDHHKQLNAAIVSRQHDIFGLNGGLDVVSNQLATDVPAANDNLVYTFTSDFGRQLAANGSAGTDHGRGTYSILIGNAVNGGVYGEMFPQHEAVPDPGDSLGRSPLEIPGTDINGLTSFERVLAQACDWATPGSGGVVFPNAASSNLEAGVDLSGLFTT
jgi:uncharacterized protein (DUF1501 family)